MVGPSGFCQFSETEPYDSKALANIRRSPNSYLLAMYAECSVLKRVRQGAANNTGDFLQYTVYRTGSQSAQQLKEYLKGTAAQKVKQSCIAMRSLNRKDISDLSRSIEDQLSNLNKLPGNQQLRILGVLGEDALACYSGLLFTVAPGAKLASVKAVTFINGQQIFVTLAVRFTGPESFTKTLSRLKDVVASFHAANPVLKQPN